MAKMEIILGMRVQGNICDRKGNTIKAFKGNVIGFTKNQRVRIKNDAGEIKNFSKDEVFHLNKNDEIGFS